jgi:hypothetical protein
LLLQAIFAQYVFITPCIIEPLFFCGAIFITMAVFKLPFFCDAVLSWHRRKLLLMADHKNNIFLISSITTGNATSPTSSCIPGFQLGSIFKNNRLMPAIAAARRGI